MTLFGCHLPAFIIVFLQQTNNGTAHRKKAGPEMETDTDTDNVDMDGSTDVDGQRNT